MCDIGFGGFHFFSGERGEGQGAALKMLGDWRVLKARVVM